MWAQAHKILVSRQQWKIIYTSVRQIQIELHTDYCTYMQRYRTENCGEGPATVMFIVMNNMFNFAGLYL